MRRTAVLWIVVIAIIVTGCQIGKPREPITIEVWDGPRPDTTDNKFAWIESVIAEFKEKNPDVNVVLTKTPWQEMVTRLDQQLVAGSWPDIVPLSVGAGGIRAEHLTNGLIESTDEYWSSAELADLFPAARQAFTVGGKMYGFPQTMSLYLLMLNLEIFRERGVEPPEDGRWTFEQFEDTAKKLTFIRPKTKKAVYGFATYINKGYYEVWPFLYMDGARPLSSDLAVFTFDSPEAQSALQKLVDLKYKSKVASPLTGSSDHSGVWQAFASPHERSVAIEPWPDWAAMLAATDPRFETDFMVARYPTGTQGKPVTIGAAYGFSVLKQDNKKAKRLAMELAEMLADPKGQDHFASGFGIMPARRSVAESAKFPHPELRRAASFLNDVELPPAHPKWIQIENSINAEVQTALIGEKAVEYALKDARREVEKLISLTR